MAISKAIYLCSATRSAIGSFGGGLGTLPAPEIGAQVLQAVLKRSGLAPDAIDQVIVGCVLSAGMGQAPTRQVALKGGLPITTQALTVNKVCSSGLKAVMLAANEIALGDAEVVIAGGMESMSLTPYYAPTMRNGARLGHTQLEDGIIKDALWDVYNNYHMGNCAELCAKEFSIGRKEQDEFCLESYRRANAAIASGHFSNEIAPLKVMVGKNETEVKVDEEPGKLKLDKVPDLRPVFQKDGTVTAANASSLSDGASLMVVCSEAALKKHNLKPMARIVSTGWKSREPEWFTIAPVGAVERALERAQLNVSDIDLFEINEAFSVVALACARELKLDSAKLNVSGGAVAIGHPVGASGARILTTLLHNLERLQQRRGAVAICNGGGEATSMIVERV